MKGEEGRILKKKLKDIGKKHKKQDQCFYTPIPLRT